MASLRRAVRVAIRVAVSDDEAGPMTLRLFSRRESVRDAVKRRVGLSTLPPAREAVREAQRIVTGRA